MTSRVLPHIPGVAAGLGRAGHAAPAVPCPTAHLKVSAALRRGWQARGTSHPPGVTPLVSPPWYGRRILREAPRAAGGARCHMRLPGADTGHLLRPLLSIAEFTTSPPAGCRRGGEHLEAIVAVTLQGDTAPQRGEPDPSAGSLLPPSAQQMSREPASCHQRGPACSRAPPRKGNTRHQRVSGRGMGLSPMVSCQPRLETPSSARAGGSAVGKLPRDLALCFGDGLRAGAFQPGAEKVSGRS